MAPKNFGRLALAAFTIEIKRGEKQGKLICTKVKVKVKVKTTCWWDLKNKKGTIPAGNYSGCSATQMATKKLDAIFIPKVKGWTGVFICPGVLLSRFLTLSSHSLTEITPHGNWTCRTARLWKNYAL